MDQAVTALIVATLLTMAMGVTAIGLSFKARGEQASKFAAAEVERQTLANEERQRALKDREALAAALEEFRTQFASERLQRIERDKEVARLNEQKRILDNKLDELERNQRQNIASIAALEQKNAALQGDLEKLRKETAELRAELAIVKNERDVALATVEKKNGELKEARATIERMEQLLQDQTQELSSIRERLEKLEAKPPDTSALPPINPAPTEHQDGKDAHPPSAE